ncbi:glycine zipper 2TM domain-containing protein [Rugamonas apoptosis]|uniref:Glycine zipper 2TM domain-containing protein n=1 Tax=Rugamonas apoptosis TaxID=2758570 RepID=A0A7W2FEF5_9BURK|nr:glycine zipper 2TM domain-containing protein [Rugamonas apoptosis]MBA5690221.1 glycine zipper 2TM domain-containing protein [Rugamonas apoptosis]
MEKIPTVTRRIHPLIAGAAISVTVLSLVGTAAIAGWLPSSKAKGDINPGANPVPANALTSDLAPGQAQPPLPPAEVQQAQYQQPEQQPQRQQQPAVHHTARPHHSTQVAQADDYDRRAQSAPQPAPAPAPANSSPNYVGIGAGAVIGGLLGNQVGGGRGRTAATIAGAIGGGMLGNQIQEQQKQPQR